MSKRTVHRTEEVIDSETGNIVRSVYTVMVDKPKGDIDFVKVFKCFTMRVIEDLGIENGKAKLLFWFIDQVQGMRINQIPIVVANAEMMSNDLGCAVVSVRKWLSFLIDRGYILRHVAPNGKILRNAYYVNPEYVLKGKLIRDKDDV